MTYIDRLENELRQAALREEARRHRHTRAVLRWSARRVAVPAIALAAALLIGITVGRWSADEARKLPAVGALPSGMYMASAEGEQLKLWVRQTSIRLVDVPDHDDSQFLGFPVVDGNRLKIASDPSRTYADPWDDPACSGRSRDRVGEYRLLVGPDTLEFELVRDPCRSRRDVLAGRVWRRESR